MGQNFLAADRDQAFLLPPDVRDWLPEGHFVWFVLDAVAQLDLGAFYAGYRQDGHGRVEFPPLRWTGVDWATALAVGVVNLILWVGASREAARPVPPWSSVLFS
jgi:hypothetical protein